MIVLDIETYPLDDAAEFLEEFTAPANYKDPEKIASYIADKRAEAIAKCALDLDLCRIVAIGVDDLQGNIVVAEAHDEVDERTVLLKFWNDWYESPTIGFNSLGFDLPVLIRRSQYLGVPTPNISLDRYRTPHIDLMERLSFNGKLRARGLAFYCKRFGIAFDDPTKGADIGDLVRGGKWEEVAAHCAADLKKTRALAERLGVLETIAA